MSKYCTYIDGVLTAMYSTGSMYQAGHGCHSTAGKARRYDICYLEQRLADDLIGPYTSAVRGQIHYCTLDPTIYSRTWTSSSLLLRVAGIQRRAVPVVAAVLGGKATLS